MASYLITGGAGFIGSHLCETLISEGHSVTVIDNLSTGKDTNLPPHVRLIEGDIRDGSVLREAMQGASGCFHLAAIASVDKSNTAWTETHQINLSGTINVFEAARDMGCIPVVFASSAAIYGAEPTPPIAEDAPKRPLSAYGADKLACELHAVPAWHVHGVPSTALRLFNVYGPRQDPKSPYSGVISIFANRLISGENITIHGDGSQTRDFIFVSDVCAAFLAAMQNTKHGASVYNVCTGEETSILQLAETLAEITAYNQPFSYGEPRAGDIPKSYGNRSKLEAELDVVPLIGLTEGLSKLVQTTLATEKAI